MTLFHLSGTWANGTVHRAIDDQWCRPDPEQVMAFFLKLSEETVINALVMETDKGTLTQDEAERILIGYCKKKKRTLNAYDEEV